MLKLLAMLIGAAHAQAVDLNTYLVFSTPAAAILRSQQMCTAVSCVAPNTRCWWNMLQLSDGRGALQVQPNGPYSKSAIGVTACAVGCGLAAGEQSRLVTAASLGAALVNATQVTCP